MAKQIRQTSGPGVVHLENLEVAQALLDIAELLDLEGASPHKIRAYRQAAEAIDLLPEEIEHLWREGRLRSIHGVGESIAAKVEELLQTGRIAYLEERRRALPPGLGELLQVPGLGARMAELLYSRLGIASLDQLESAARQGGLRELPGMGVKGEAAVLAAIDRLRTRGR